MREGHDQDGTERREKEKKHEKEEKKRKQIKELTSSPTKQKKTFQKGEGGNILKKKGGGMN